MCHGYRCHHCNDTGSWELNQCANEYVTPGDNRMIKWCLRAEELGILPLGPVALNNTQSFLDAWEFVRLEVQQTKHKLGID